MTPQLDNSNLQLDPDLVEQEMDKLGRACIDLALDSGYPIPSRALRALYTIDRLRLAYHRLDPRMMCLQEALDIGDSAEAGAIMHAIVGDHHANE